MSISSGAEVLDVELRTELLDMSYPMIKCSTSRVGERQYYLPFDPNYDTIKIDRRKDEHFVKTVKEAVEKGFQRAEFKK
ncbi:hypothetical protein D3C87_1081650 [compost metagenome]